MCQFFNNFQNIEINCKKIINFEKIKGIFYRANVPEQFLSYDLRNHYDIISVINVTNRTIKYSPDILNVNNWKPILLKKSIINLCKEKEIFIEVSLNNLRITKNEKSNKINKSNIESNVKSNCKSNNCKSNIAIINGDDEDVLNILKLIRKLLKLRAHKILIISPGNNQPEEVKNLLKELGVKNADKILKNNLEVLKKAFLKKYSEKNTIVDLNEIEDKKWENIEKLL